MKQAIAILLTLALALSLAACGFTVVETPNSTADTKEPLVQTEEETKDLATITVMVTHSNGITNSFQYDTAEEFVGSVLQKAGLIEGNDGPYGLEITVVDGEQAIYNTDGAYWALYEGEEYALQGIDATPVVDGGTYKLVYTNA